MLPNYDSTEDLRAAIEWEGGITELIDYGVLELPEHFDTTLRELWADMVSSWMEFQDTQFEFETKLRGC